VIPGNEPIRTRPVPVCPVCGQHGDVLHRSITDRAYGVPGQWQTMRCSHCQSGWLNPAPVPDDLARCYVGGYYTHNAPPAPTMGSSKAISFLRAAVLSAQKGYRHLQPATPFAPVIGWLLTQIPLARQRASFDEGRMVVPFRKDGRLLEIGCGDGSYLALMRMLGWNVSGVEPDPVAAEVASRSSGCQVHVGMMENAPFESGSFHAVVSDHVIEHVYDPRAFVLSVARLLAKDGMVVVRTPNFQSLGHKLFGADLFSLDPPRHLCLFTPKSLRDLFVQSGLFREVRTTTPTADGRLAFRRRLAVLRTGNFLGEIKFGGSARCAELLFRTLEMCGSGLFHWGEEIVCTAIRD
jgi:SAM-dependent methyltransferase